jgi:hypothetical protein
MKDGCVSVLAKNQHQPRKARATRPRITRPLVSSERKRFLFFMRPFVKNESISVITLSE